MAYSELIKNFEKIRSYILYAGMLRNIWAW